MSHLKGLLTTWLKETDDTCIVIPCDSTEAWIVAAYDQTDGIETIEEPWEHIIAHGKYYHNIRIPGQKKRTSIFEQFVPTVCENWSKVTKLFRAHMISSSLFWHLYNIDTISSKMPPRKGAALLI